MSKYIDASYLMYKFENAYDDEMSEFNKEYAHGIGIAQHILEEMPAADVEPVRHGHWIRETDGGTRCSCCMETVKEDSNGVKTSVDLSDMAYCPKCGAKMDGGNK